MSNQIKYINNRQNGRVWHKKASVAFSVGMALEIDGVTGFVQPATNSHPVLGICNQEITASSPNYALNDQIGLSEAVYDDELEFTVSTGSATALMEGRYVPLDAAATGVVVAGISQTVSVATPILITKFINATTVRGKIAFRF